MNNFLTELLVELLAGGLMYGILYLKNKSHDKNRQKKEDQLKLLELNNSKNDQILLIDSIEEIADRKRFESASLVLMKEPQSQMYNIVIKNKYGSEGKIIA